MALVAKGADVHLKADNGYSEYSHRRGTLSTLGALTGASADRAPAPGQDDALARRVSLTRHRWTALHFASLKGHGPMKTAKALVAAGAAIVPAELDGLPLPLLKTLCVVYGLGFTTAEKAPDLVARLRARRCAEVLPTKKRESEVRTPPRPPTHTPPTPTHPSIPASLPRTRAR
jgi:hypothetical protein